MGAAILTIRSPYNYTVQQLHYIHLFFSTVCPEFLWMAPELLREYPPRKCTQSGDVYSFAIILYEMCTRREPYVTEDWYESLEGTSVICHLLM